MKSIDGKNSMLNHQISRFLCYIEDRLSNKRIKIAFIFIGEETEIE